MYVPFNAELRSAVRRVYEVRIWKEALYQRSACDATRRCASARIIRFVCRGSSTGRAEQFRNRINLLSPIGCPRHCRDVREFFILQPSLLLLPSRLRLSFLFLLFLFLGKKKMKEPRSIAVFYNLLFIVE